MKRSRVPEFTAAFALTFGENIPKGYWCCVDAHPTGLVCDVYPRDEGTLSELITLYDSVAPVEEIIFNRLSMGEFNRYVVTIDDDPEG